MATNITVLNEPCFINKDGEVVPYLSREIITHRDAYAASLHIILEHTAKFHVLVAEIIAEKYNLNVDEMMKAVREDDRFQLGVSDPGLHALGYFDQRDLEKTAVTVPPAIPVVVEEVVKVKKVVCKKPTASTASTASTAPVPVPDPANTPAAKPKKILKKMAQQ
jgi:hypothetical protein